MALTTAAYSTDLRRKVVQACERSSSGTDSSQHLPVAPNTLDRRFNGWLPNRAWVADLTYIATAQGWLYLAVIMDLACRRIIGWSMSEQMKAGLVYQALRSAYGQRRPTAGLILHSDQGSQNASRAYRRLAADFGIQVSMSRGANVWDNAAMESFFKTLKVEQIYQGRYQTRKQPRLAASARLSVPKISASFAHAWTRCASRDIACWKCCAAP